MNLTTFGGGDEGLQTSSFGRVDERRMPELLLNDDIADGFQALWSSASGI